MIPLNLAVLCVECDTISRGRNNCCELCGSQALLSLANVLDRAATAPEKPQHVMVRAGVA